MTGAGRHTTPRVRGRAAPVPRHSGGRPGCIGLALTAVIGLGRTRGHAGNKERAEWSTRTLDRRWVLVNENLVEGWEGAR